MRGVSVLQYKVLSLCERISSLPADGISALQALVLSFLCPLCFVLPVPVSYM